MWRSMPKAGRLTRLHIALCGHPPAERSLRDLRHEGKSGDPLQVIYNPVMRGKYQGLAYAKRESLCRGEHTAHKAQVHLRSKCRPWPANPDRNAGGEMP